MESVVEAEVGTTLRLPVAVYGRIGFGWCWLSFNMLIKLPVIIKLLINTCMHL